MYTECALYILRIAVGVNESFHIFIGGVCGFALNEVIRGDLSVGE